MTRVLSELLGAKQLTFRRTIERLEQVSGHESTDIRLSTEIERATKYKLHELGLSAHDTTGQELYAALQVRVSGDNIHLHQVLQDRYAAADNDISRVTQLLADLPIQKRCFSIKSAVARQLLKQLPPKRAMKLLGYRSFDPMIKHETVASIFAVGQLAETVAWRKGINDRYKKLVATDFEFRPMNISHPTGKYWQALAETVVANNKHNIVVLKEFGSIVLLPLPAQAPKGSHFAMLVLSLQAMNEIRATSTYLQLNQVRSDFGNIVQQVAIEEPSLKAAPLDEPVPWQIIQRYYARFGERFHATLFEPHVSSDDLSWHSIEKILHHIDPRLGFWQHTANLGLLHDHQPVSLNVIDAVLNYCNQVPFENRIVQYVRHSIFHELMIRYLKHRNVEQVVLGGLETALAPATI
jgi:hypothetical protein